jgi:hypothetical protein
MAARPRRVAGPRFRKTVRTGRRLAEVVEASLLMALLDKDQLPRLREASRLQPVQIHPARQP